MGTATADFFIKSLALEEDHNPEVNIFQLKYNEAKLNEVENGLAPVTFFMFSKLTILPIKASSFEIRFQAVVPDVNE